MALNSAMLEQMKAEGLDLDACIRVIKAGEKKADPTNAERQARYRAKGKRNTVTVTAVSPNDNNNTLTPGSEAKASSPKHTKFSAPDGVDESVWADFLASPKRRKAGMNATAYAGINNNLRLLAEHGFPPGKMLALAVERGWTTVKLEWVQNDGQQRTNGMGRNQPSDGLSATTRAARDVFGAPASH